MARATAERNRQTGTTASGSRSSYARPSRTTRPDRSRPPAFEPAPRIEIARPLPSKEVPCHPAPPLRVFSGAELRVIALLIVLVAAIAMGIIMMAARAAVTQKEINDLKRDIAQTEDDITSIKIDIKQSQNIDMIRSRAEKELGMKEPAYDQYIYVADLPAPGTDFVTYIKERNYDGETTKLPTESAESALPEE
jgi:cell division protein FtsL